MNFVLLFLQGYTVFLEGNWNLSSFLFAYFMIFFVVGVAIAWKLLKRPRWHSPADIDITSGKKEIDEYEEALVEPPLTRFDRILGIIF
jgi:amino acid transporter